ncbi:hypothetical protein [Candidatus Protochlamydia phocaeensis]|uniref:hypothetical protein n=1 Tax=Candidatus Protochlamydia phocaeensis TaxID=1414722 RepID=UPI000AD85360|nr:hypothetical protein [Candidatus Protochlamydia phocaeensis]
MKKMTHRLTEELKLLSFENHDSCIKCQYNFVAGDTTHLGYDSENEPLYVCEKCSSSLNETAIRYHFSPRPYEIPNANTQLWRYMDFAKYVSMLANEGLYFASAETFDDLFEGAKGVKKNKDKWDEFHLEFFRKAIENPPEGYLNELSKEEVEQNSQRLLKGLERAGLSSKKFTFVNCWHENEFESEAMWRLYSNYFENAVAIKTSFKNLYISMGKNPSISIGRIKYLDLNNKYAGVNNAFWRKRKSFEYEREVRAILIDPECNDRGKIIKCDLSILIEEIFVSPKSPAWFVKTINDVNNKYGLKVKVSTSQLNEEPFF